MSEKLFNVPIVKNFEIIKGDGVMNEIIENFRQLFINSWNRHDRELHEVGLKLKTSSRIFFIGNRKITSWADFMRVKELNKHEMNAIDLGPTQASKAENEKGATCLVNDLIERIQSVTGKIIDISSKCTENGNYWYVKGEKTNAEVSNIFAGGFNLIRLRVTSLIKKVE